MKKIIVAVLALVAIWFSFYTEPLSEHNAREAMKQYNPEQIVDYCWENKFSELQDNAMQIGEFAELLKADPEALQNSKGKLLGIGSNVYYIIKGESDGVTYSDNEFRFEVNGVKCNIPVKYIFGNVARDASGWFDVSDFRNTMDFNSVSACMNRRIKEQVVAQYISEASAYTSCTFCAAIEVKPGQKEVSDLRLFPYQLTMKLP